MAKGNEIQVTANTVSLISAGTEIRGEIDCGGDLRIDGSVVGYSARMGIFRAT